MSEMHSGPSVSFLCDQNLGRLAKWLRVLGHDTECMPCWDDARVSDAIALGRVVLTRKQSMAKRSNTLVITHDKVKEQLRDVATLFHLADGVTSFSRCTLCNAVLDSVAREEVKGFVPEYVYATHGEFVRCPSCKRIYWKGTQFHRAQEMIISILGEGSCI
jgi:uncharacterized protein